MIKANYENYEGKWMNKSGQITLVLISVLFSAFQTIVEHDRFFTIDFLIFTAIAWVVGWQYDRTRYYGKQARASEESYKQLIDSLPNPFLFIITIKLSMPIRLQLSCSALIVWMI